MLFVYFVCVLWQTLMEVEVRQPYFSFVHFISLSKCLIYLLDTEQM
jgi:hypothetical protein